MENKHYISNMKNNYYVYLHIRLDNGQPFYVGKGLNNRSYTKSSRGIHWKNIVNKYGFDVIILEKNLTEEESYKLEKYWIDKIGRKDLNDGLLINLNDGGKGGLSNYKHTEQSRKKMSNSHKGKIFSKELREYWSKNRKSGTSKLVLNTETGIFYETIKEAAQSLNINHYTLCDILKGRIKTNKTTIILT